MPLSSHYPKITKPRTSSAAILWGFRMGVTTKTQLTLIDGTPEKRMFWSIISDYDLKTGVCELVDNSIDLWTTRGRRKPLSIRITLDEDQQLICASDNAGGVKLSQLSRLVAPGGSQNDPAAEVIGIFGVGSKRAGVALGKLVEIRTRYGREKSLGIDVAEEWLESTDWQIAAYEVPDIDPGCTHVTITKLRRPITPENKTSVRHHLSEVYASFLSDECKIYLNGIDIGPTYYDIWSYPPDHRPQEVTFDINVPEMGSTRAEITGGLIGNRNPDEENYGVYIYCNNRLIVKDMRIKEVGYFVSSEAGVPHPDASLCRVIVKLNGPARQMPWNSSKSGVNLGHPVFEAIKPIVVQLVSHFSKVSRRTKDDWPGKVFAHSEGEVEHLPRLADPKAKLSLPPLPRGHIPQAEDLKSLNAKNFREKPWTLGLVESIAAVDIIIRKNLETRNRLALIILDSAFEIALKEYIVHNPDIFPKNVYNEAKLHTLFANRTNVINEINPHVDLNPVWIVNAQHYYAMRNKLIHERATVDIPDADILNYRGTVQAVLKVLFGLKFR